MEERTFDLRGHSTSTKSQNHELQWRSVGWKDTSRHFVNSISLSFPLPAHEFSYRPRPVSHVCFFSRLSIRKFLKHSSKRALIVSRVKCVGKTGKPSDNRRGYPHLASSMHSPLYFPGFADQLQSNVSRVFVHDRQTVRREVRYRR